MKSMLSTLIYRSRLSPACSVKELNQIVTKAQARNAALEITGILLFDGDYFLQVLEGAESAVNQVYGSIRRDPRHCNLVELMRDYAPLRRFGNLGMELFDTRRYAQGSILEAVLQKGTSRYNLAYDDRALKFIRSFVEGHWRAHLLPCPDSANWRFATRENPFSLPMDLIPGQPCQFALQPIVEPLRGQISSLEALIRGTDGGSPAGYFASVAPEKVYEADLLSKNYAFALAKRIGIGNHKIAVNLLPMSLVMVPNAVGILLDQIARNGLIPEQVVVEVTEDEVISRFDEFVIAIRQLRSAGIALAIDDFGSGFAGLSLLSKFQPEKLKLDRTLVSDIHINGPKQAIVQAIINCCAALEITIVAEGVEKVEEWCWLQAAGIQRFQGYLFARPLLNGVPPVAWPDNAA